ncbi:MAG TPA: chromosomal replication initiator protein DnaA [Herpetosiphonaceae bacterium]
MNTKQIWQAALGDLQLQLPRSEFDTWIKETTLVDLADNQAIIGTPNIFAREKLEGRYVTPIRDTLHTILGYPVQVQVVIGASGDAPPAADEDREVPKPNGYAGRATGYLSGNYTSTRSHNAGAQQLELPTPRMAMLNPRYTFSSYIVGSSNRLAHAACLAVAEHPASAYNPLFLYGGVGLGKTHLLHAIGNYALDANPEVSVLYVSSEKFTNDLINAIRRQNTEEFRLRYRNIDVLLIDDIQFITGKEATQEEFFHTFNTLHGAGKQIVISSDKPPKAIVTLEERLRSRFEWGLIVDVQSPDLETRTAILRGKAESLNVRVPDEVIDFLAHRIQSNIRELEGSLNRVVAFANLNRQSISVELASTALSELLENSRRQRITTEAILESVSKYYGVDTKILKGRQRSRNIVVPRQIAMYLMREETESSLVEIGSALGGRDHTTVLHGCEKIAEQLNTDSRLRSDVLEIRNRLYNGNAPAM